MKKSLWFALCVCCLLLLEACGGGTTQPSHVATHFSVTASAAATIGTACNVTVSALDASNNVVSTYSGTAHFTSSDNKAVLPPDSKLTSGSTTFSVTFKTPGSQTVTATDTASGLIAGSSGSISVGSPAATHFSVTAPGSATTGTAFSFTVTALDAANNTAASYTGKVHFTSPDTHAVLPADSTLMNGVATFSATLNATVDSQTITVTDSAIVSITGTSNSINVSPPPATHFSVTAPATATSGTAFTFTVTALDALNNTAAGYSGTAHFTSTDGQADLPANSGLTNGIATFPAAMKTMGGQTITATDTVTTSITGISSSINVSAAAAANPVPLIYQPLSPEAVAIGGTGFTGTLTVIGTGFVSGSVVHWNGIARATKFVNDSKLTATVLAADIASANTASVTVVNPAPGGGASNVLFFETTRATSSVALSAPSELASGAGPFAVAIGDLNGDGRLDLVVANSGSNNVSVLLGKGDGTFQPAVDYGVGTTPYFVAVGDFNGDGRLDLVVANSGSNNVSVLLGTGDGTFQPAVDYGAGTNPDYVVVGDFNGDGKLDVAALNGKTVSILLGNGDGTLQPALNFDTGSWSGSMAVGDFNGDGNLDLAVLNIGASSVSVLLGNGDGTFQPIVSNSAGSAPVSVAVGDFNGDGKLDLAVAGINNSGPASVNILLGNGNGTFQPPVGYTAGSNSEYTFVVAADFNGDGKLDLAVADTSTNPTNNISILLGNGDGTFQPVAHYGAGSKFPVAVGDFNGDGRPDLAVGGAVSSTVSFLLQPPLVSGANAFLSTDSLTFATQLVGTTSTVQTVLLSNYGTTALSISDIATTANFGETNDCGSSLPVGATCTIIVAFSPMAKDNLTGTLSVTDDAPGSPHTISLSGTGTVVLLNPASLSFGCIPEPIGQCTCFKRGTTMLTNVGSTPLNISSITVTGSSQTNTCPSSLGAGQSCTISVYFTSEGVITINDDGGASPQTVPLNAGPQLCHR